MTFFLRAFAATALVALAAATSIPPAAVAQSGISPVALVNDRVITNYDVDQRARLLAFNGAPQNEQLAQVAFDQLVEDRLKLDAGEEFGVAAADIDPAALLATYAEQRGLSPEALPGALQRTGASVTALEDALVADAIWRESVRRRFGPRAQPSEAEIEQEIALGGTGGAVSYRLAEIAIPLAAGDEQARAAADRALAELQRGAEFGSVARRYSRSPSAAQGGEIGWLPRAGLPVEAQTAVAGTSVGGVTQPIQTSNALVILSVLDRREKTGLAQRAATDLEAREELRSEMVERRLQRFAAGYLQELRGDAVIERR